MWHVVIQDNNCFADTHGTNDCFADTHGTNFLTFFPRCVQVCSVRRFTLDKNGRKEIVEKTSLRPPRWKPLSG